MPSIVAARDDITGLLDELSENLENNKSELYQQLMILVYSELKVLARANRYRWQGQENLGTTSLVHESYVKLTARRGAGYGNRRQFFAVASKAMRSILVDNARRHRRQKRGGGQVSLPLNEERLVSAERCEELLALDEALTHLDEREPRLARIVECRCFGGLTTNETAEALEISSATVKRRWNLARAWLYRDMQAEES